MSGPGRLAGRTVVVTRAAEQAGRLVRLLEAEGAAVLEVPVVRVAEPEDGGRALVAVAARLREFGWIVLTSPNGVAALAAAAGGSLAAARRLAVVGPGTADAARAAGATSVLVPERFVAEGLLEVFPLPGQGAGEGGGGPAPVLLAQAEAARPVLADGLRARGWEVEAVVAYRTAPAAPPEEVVRAAAAADAVTFTSGSTVRAYLAAAGPAAVPPCVVCIGPVTAAAAAEAGLPVAAVATPHDLTGLVEAVVAALGQGPSRPAASGTQP